MRAPLTRVAVVAGALLIVAAVRPDAGTAGPVVRVGVAAEGVDAMTVGGGRVFWSTYDGDATSLYSAGFGTGARRVLRVGEVAGYDDAWSALWASPQLVAVQVEGYWTGPHEDGTDIVARAAGPVGAASLRRFAYSSRIGSERLQDIASAELLTVAVKRLKGRWTVRAYVRSDARVQPVGPRLKLARDEWSGTVEGRLSARWMALLRRHGVPRITVYDRWTNRPAWTVRLPRPPSGRDDDRREVAWDLDEKGTLSFAIETVTANKTHETAALYWARPRSRSRRLTRAVLPRYPFVLREGELYYARPSRIKGRFRLYARTQLGGPRALTGVLPAGPVASDGRLVAAAVPRGSGVTACILAAALPVAPGQRWTCARSAGER